MIADEHESHQLSPIEELRHLVGQRDVLKENIEKGKAELSGLDRYLLAELEIKRAYAKHPEFSAMSQKDNATGALYYYEILQGSYQREKANFCVEEGNRFLATANIAADFAGDSERMNIAISHDIRVEQIQQSISSGRKIAAGWFLMAAKCLQVPPSNQQVG